MTTSVDPIHVDEVLPLRGCGAKASETHFAARMIAHPKNAPQGVCQFHQTEKGVPG
jgi:hypothetical protein